MSDDSHIQIDWATDSIIVGDRHRKDLGDIDTLAASIGQIGLLQPVTITPDGVLVCGARRLAAIRQLGWRHVNVWIRAGLSDKLTSLMAERDDVSNHKQYSPAELADMYAELKAEIAADAARRQQATQFGASENGVANLATPQVGEDGGVAKLATPLGTPTGDSRVQAAKMLGGASHMTMEKVLAIRQVAGDDSYGSALRRQAADALTQIDAGAPVDPVFLSLRASVQVDELNKIADDETETEKVRKAARDGAVLLHSLDAEDHLGPPELERAARAALGRVMAAKNGPKPVKTVSVKTVPTKKLKSAKQFMWLWGEMAAWPQDYDVKAIAVEVPDDKWVLFKQTMSAGIDFMGEVDQIRAANSFATLNV